MKIVKNKQTIFNKRFKLAYENMRKYIVDKNKPQELEDDTVFYLPINFVGGRNYNKIAKYLGYSDVEKIHQKGFVLTCCPGTVNGRLKVHIGKSRNG